jgi:hypothetical protein
MSAAPSSPRGFNARALFDALDQRRSAEGLSWTVLAAQLWEQSSDLNAQRRDHPISPATITGIPARGGVSCQHALFMLRWLGQPPEDFIAEPRPGTAGVPLPATDPAHRLRWDLAALYDAINDVRKARGATWAATAERLYCTPSQLTGLRTAKFATSMRLAMRICQAMRRPAADFVYAATW